MEMLIECSVRVQDAPVESAESQWILKTETVTTLSSLVKVIKEPWEAQFGVELQKNLYPSITVRLVRKCPLKTTYVMPGKHTQWQPSVSQYLMSRVTLSQFWSECPPFPKAKIAITANSKAALLYLRVMIRFTICFLRLKYIFFLQDHKM